LSQGIEQLICERSFYIIGSKVGLAEPVSSDIQLMFAIWQDPLVQKNFNFVPAWHSYDEYLASQQAPDGKKSRFLATIWYRKDKQAIGAVSLAPDGLEPDLAIWLHRDFRRKGLGAEAFGLAIQFIFQNFDLSYILTGVYEHNLASISLMNRLHFRRYPKGDVLENNVFGKGQVKQLAFRLLSTEWCEKFPAT
jgi:RimJ/RimL family protein N-acetyltransferase